VGGGRRGRGDTRCSNFAENAGGLGERRRGGTTDVGTETVVLEVGILGESGR